MNLGKALLSSLGTVAVPTVAGTPFQGGYYAGKLRIGAQSYALIVAPKASGQSSTTLQIRTTLGNVPGSISDWDGAANTDAMILAGAVAHPAANFCKGLTIGGYTDWFLPAKDQLDVLYREFKPTTTSNNSLSGANTNSDPATANYTAFVPSVTTVTSFISGGLEAFDIDFYYATSTQVSSTVNYVQLFSNGTQGNNQLKTASYRVRAVRMIPI